MPGKILLSTSYLPPIEYFARINQAEEVFIEKEENYLKQTYRNRCYILSSHGPQLMTIPVHLGSFHKTRIRDTRIDYSKRWQQVHLRTLTSSYNSAPYFLYYFEVIEKIIRSEYNFLLDLNLDLLMALLKILRIETRIAHTTHFIPVGDWKGDFRYTIHPKMNSLYKAKEYFQVFNSIHGFVPQLSIVDLVFNMGPESIKYL